MRGNAGFTEAETEMILDLLKKEYPEAECALRHRNTYELLVAVVLSAQTTDRSVNKVTEELFRRYPSPEMLAGAAQEDVMELIRSIGMYRTKSGNIIKLARKLTDEQGGVVPDDYDSLIALPGVGRKTANVVLSVGFGHQRIAVDTHVLRVSNRIGLTRGASVYDPASTPSDVLRTEKALMETLPESRWTEAHHSLIFHGRRCCTARKPGCGGCVLKDICMSAEQMRACTGKSQGV